MKKILLVAAFGGLLAVSNTVFAQDEKKEKVETEEIVIQNNKTANGKKDVQLNIKISGDNITVNGKPLDEYTNEQVKISKRKIMICDGDDAMTLNFEGDHPNFDEFIKQWQGDKEEKRTFLGVTTDEVEGGVKVIDVTEASAAEKAGLKEGDIITKIDDIKVTNPESLSKLIKDKKPNDEVKIYYKRDGKEKNVKAVLGERTERKKMAFAFSAPYGGGTFVPEMDMENMENMGQWEGIAPMPPVPPMPPRQKKIGLKIQDTQEGGNVKVIAVEDSSAAALAGLKKDDLIVEIDGVKITNTDEAREQLSPEEGKSTYKIKALRNGSPQTFEVKIPKILKTANL